MKFAVEMDKGWKIVKTNSPMDALEKAYGRSFMIWNYVLYYNRKTKEMIWAFEPDVQEEWSFLPLVKAYDKQAIKKWKDDAKLFGFYYDKDGKRIKTKDLSVLNEEHFIFSFSDILLEVKNDNDWKNINWKVLQKKGNFTDKDIQELIKIAKRYGFNVKGVVDGEKMGLSGQKLIEYEHKKRKLKGFSPPEGFAKLLYKLKVERAYKYWLKEYEASILDSEITDEVDVDEVYKKYVKIAKLYMKLWNKKRKPPYLDEPLHVPRK